MDTNPLEDPSAIAEFVASSSIGDIKTALAAIEGDALVAAAAAVLATETGREDQSPRKTLVDFLTGIADAASTPSPSTDSATPPDATPGNTSPPAPPAEPPAATDERHASKVTVDRDCTLNIDGQLLKCKAGDRLTGPAAVYALRSGAPVTVLDAD